MDMFNRPNEPAHTPSQHHHDQYTHPHQEYNTGDEMNQQASAEALTGQLIKPAESTSSEAMDLDSPSMTSPPATSTATVTTSASTTRTAASSPTSASDPLSRTTSASKLRGETPSPRAKALDPAHNTKMKSMLSLCLDADNARRSAMPRSTSTPQLLFHQPVETQLKAKTP